MNTVLATVVRASTTIVALADEQFAQRIDDQEKTSRRLHLICPALKKSSVHESSSAR
jgi:hypothetical protein